MLLEEEVEDMRLDMKHMAALIGAAAITTAMAASPAAAAAPGDSQQSDQSEQSCDQEGASQYVCERPGNVQLNDPPSAASYYSRIG
jgi:hypothetical protein